MVMVMKNLKKMIKENKYPLCPFCGGKLRMCKIEEEYICKECNKYVKVEDL